MPPKTAKPKKSIPLSLRVPDDLRVRVESYAESAGLKYRAALLKLVELGLPDTAPARDPKSIMAGAIAGAAHLGATPRKRQRDWGV